MDLHILHAQQHAINRLMERYKIALSLENLSLINIEQCQARPTTTIRIKQLRDYREERLVKIRNQWVKCVWDHFLGTIVTCIK